jgi:hypothetical protein
MSIDLDDIESRINEGIYGDDRTSDTQRDDAFAALAVLLAEVERLRGEVSYLRACVPPAHPSDYGHEVWSAALRDAVTAERAAVVAWLSAKGRAWMATYTTEWGFHRARCLEQTADDIERGEHRREEKE